MSEPLTPVAVALQAYRQTSGDAPAEQAASTDFSSLLSQALQEAVETGKHADAQAQQGIEGHGDLTQVVTAVSKAELTLQTTVAIRDRVIQAYQDIIKMPI